MNLLAIDTSTELASVALMCDGNITCEQQDSPKTHAQHILPMIDKLMSDANLSMSQLNGIIFGCGPGSFTGLRIACSVAKGLAYSYDLGLIPVSSLGAIAWAAREQQSDVDLPILAVLDARMNELYWSYFAPKQSIGIEKVSAAGNIMLPNVEPIMLAGVGMDLYWPDFSHAIKSQVIIKTEVFPTASAMISLAINSDIQQVSVEKAEPIYVRNQVTQGISRG
ncbi:MAG: tRNA (adenosine(37)-N6)-threonylcarbamoyltransferase complex dimerization subunit type 1 TsaB [bacterium]|nr:tRNA (adenosine(37)-N6)-threonylcarbamoyltransferase complex dimerization subunit type 1 TsaB [bacterium]